MLHTWKAILIFVRSNRLSSLITVKFTIYLCWKQLPVGIEFVDPNSNTICWTLNNNMLLKACSGFFFFFCLSGILGKTSGEHSLCLSHRRSACKDMSISWSKWTGQSDSKGDVTKAGIKSPFILTHDRHFNLMSQMTWQLLEKLCTNHFQRTWIFFF